MRERVNRRVGLADFLQNRRARLQPDQFHLPTASRRRAPGLRREELAQLVGVGVSWYTWLEQGRDIQVSNQVLERLADILHLTSEERRHLFLLAQGPQHPLEGRSQNIGIPNTTYQIILDGFHYPALIFDERLNIVGWNAYANRVFGDYSSRSERERNAVWYHFMDPIARILRVHWEWEARSCLASLHAKYDQHPEDQQLQTLIVELQQGSLEFRAWWSEHEVQLGCGGLNEIQHPQVGRLALHSTVFPMPEQPNFQMVVYTPLDREDTALKLNLLMAGESYLDPISLEQ